MSDLLQRKREIIATTNSIGWRYITDLATEAVTQAERRAIDEEDDAKGTRLRNEARAARKFLREFLAAVEAARSVEASDAPVTEDDYFYDVAY